jgi:MFS family permease
MRALIAFPVALACYGLATELPAAVLAIAVVGACYIGVLSGLNTVVQLRAPEEARGRILGLYMMALGTIYPIGAVIQGAIGGAVGIRYVTVGAGVLLVLILGGLALFRSSLFSSLDDPVAPESPASPTVSAEVGGASP